MNSLARRVLPEEHLNDETISKCMNAAKDEYNRRWAENTRPYEGIGELLSGLEERGVAKVVLSNKPDNFTQITVDRFLGDWSFQIVRGVKPSVPKKPDPSAALQIARELGIPADRFLYLGDTNTDMQTALAAGMYPVGALWGFRSAEELVESGARALVERPQDVLNLLGAGEADNPG
jgi:phosphoglycolate phosphatase